MLIKHTFYKLLYIQTANQIARGWRHIKLVQISLIFEFFKIFYFLETPLLNHKSFRSNSNAWILRLDLRRERESGCSADKFQPFLIQQYQMKSLSQQQIKQEQLKLLETNGSSLAQYASNNNNSSPFKDLSQNTKIQEIERLKTAQVKNFGLSSNANLKAFAFAILTSIFANPVKQDILNILKSCLYSPEMDLTFIKHHPLPKLSNQQMKKLIVEFFFTLTYASYDDKIEDKLRKYPIVMDILIIFFRCLLFKFKVKKADDSLFALPTKEIYEILINMLDINCKLSNSIYLLYDDHIFIYQNENKQVLTGNYSQNESQRNNMYQLKKTLKLSQLEQEFDDDTENDRSQQPSMSNHDRSLQLRGVVSQSIVFQPEAPTPFFNLDSDNNSSFQSNQEQGNEEQIQIKRQKDSFMRGSKEMSLLKMMDRSLNFHQNNIGLGNIARSKIIQNQMKQSIQQKQGGLGMIMDSPITLDSPHTLFSDGNFGSIGNDLQVKQEIRVMKKSKSESASRMSKTIQNKEQIDVQKDMKKKQRIHYQKITTNCVCFSKKQNTIKLCSNLYEINMVYVPSATNQLKNGNNYNSAINAGRDYRLYTSSKGINCQFEAATAHNTSLQYIRRNTRKESTNPNLDMSMHSCTALPRAFKDSQTHSRRQFSPISNTAQRSSSPFGQTKSIVSPKVTFTYQNKLKCSTQLSQFRKKIVP